MKTYKLLLVVGLLLLGFNASAVTINAGAFDGTYVGDVDGFLYAAPKVGSEASETTWVNNMIAGDIEFVIKSDEDIPLYGTDTSNVFAFELTSDSPDYFLVKNAQYMALFENVADFNWGVFNITDVVDDEGFVIDMNLGDITISHVTEFNGTDGTRDFPNPVPVPAAAWLMVSGLLGIIAVGRRKA